jgi:hypothetical protein
MVGPELSGQTEPTSAAGHLSPDGYWWWDGTRWVPTLAQQQLAPMTAAAPRRPVPWLRISAGSTAISGVVATLVASILPYGTFRDPTGGPTTTSSIFSGGFAGAGWDVPEPVFAMLAGAAAATLVFIGINRLAQAISAGVLIAVGLQTATMWAAYFGLAATDGSPEAGGLIGVVGAALMFIGGLLALAALATTAEPAPQPATGA